MALLFVLFSNQYGLPADLLSSLCYVESRHVPNKVHYDDGIGDSIGVCQIKIISARQVGFKGTEAELLEPKNNIKYAAKYLKHQIDRYDSISKGVIAYNQGSTKMLTTTRYQRRVYSEWMKQTLNVATE